MLPADLRRGYINDAIEHAELAGTQYNAALVLHTLELAAYVFVIPETAANDCSLGGSLH